MKALLIIDLQNDFLEIGVLAIPGAEKIIPLINRLMTKFDHIFATQDWHPKNHISFASTYHKSAGEVLNGQILWPDHCVQNTFGAKIAPDLNKERIEKIFQKGVLKNVDSYSAFFDSKHERSTNLHETLQKLKINELYFTGLATDYCVLFSVLDALKLGYKVKVIEDACQALHDPKKALDKMRSKGAEIIHSSEIL